MKDVYLYIDESGTLVKDDDSKFFIISCYITDSPLQIQEDLQTLYNDIVNDPYLAFEINEFYEQGFHACENHFDIRSKFYSLLVKLNIRIYSIVISKESKCYEELCNHYNNTEDLYAFFARELLFDRIQSERMNHIHFVFEEYGSSIQKHKSNMQKVVARIAKEVRGKNDISIDVDIHSKEDILLSVIDYVNFVIFQLLKDIEPAKNLRMIANFKLIEPKIALLHSLHNGKYYSSLKNINFEEIKGRLEVK